MKPMAELSLRAKFLQAKGNSDIFKVLQSSRRDEMDKSPSRVMSGTHQCIHEYDDASQTIMIPPVQKRKNNSIQAKVTQVPHQHMVEHVKRARRDNKGLSMQILNNHHKQNTQEAPRRRVGSGSRLS